jgi:hypothetical protein
VNDGKNFPSGKDLASVQRFVDCRSGAGAVGSLIREAAVREARFRGFELDDLWEIYDAENPLAEMATRVAQACLNDSRVEFRKWIAGLWQRRPRMPRTFRSA